MSLIIVAELEVEARVVLSRMALNVHLVRVLFVDLWTVAI